MLIPDTFHLQSDQFERLMQALEEFGLELKRLNDFLDRIDVSLPSKR